MKTVVRGFLLLWVSCFGLLSLLASGEPPTYAYGSLSVGTPFETNDLPPYTGTVAACKGDPLTIRWEVYDGSNQRISATPPQNISPALTSTQIARSGETQVVFEDNVVISLKIDGGENGYQGDARVNAIPETVCKGFPIELRGRYAGSLEQTAPNVASLLHTFALRWDANKEQLTATLIRSPSTPEQAPVTFDMTCTPLEQEDKLTCLYDPSGAAILTLEGTITATGYEGSYQGIFETTTLQVPTSGTFSFVKE